MTYYPTLAEDLARAKQILAKADADAAAVLHKRGLPLDMLPAVVCAMQGADGYAAYKLLESFVAELERRNT